MDVCINLNGTLRAVLTMGVALACAGALRASDGPVQYTGPGSCSSSSCHGGVQPRTVTSVLQNEYSTWAVQDKHTHGFEVLSNDVGRRMGRILKLDPGTSPRCTACHALDITPAQKAATFDRNDGVGCENCHGPSSPWLGDHTRSDWNYQKSVQAGMYDTRDLIKRSEKCLSCHLGDPGKYVDHEMIAAGHPDLYFEQASFEAVMPRHWKDEKDKDPMSDVRTMATGQAVQLRENMRRIARDTARFWPEYAELDCFACHHSLTAPKDSWRQESGYPGRRAGNPPWNPSRYAVFQIVVNEIDRSAGQQLDAEVQRVMALVNDVNADKAQIARAATAASDVADQLARRLATAPIDQAMARRLLKSIAADSERIAGQGERTAEQTAMAIDSLYLANGSPGNAAQIRTAINGLFQLLQNPSAYQPTAFARQMKNVEAMLP
jgi:cytochrome c554/c'-like protein